MNKILVLTAKNREEGLKLKEKMMLSTGGEVVVLVPKTPFKIDATSLVFEGELVGYRLNFNDALYDLTVDEFNSLPMKNNIFRNALSIRLYRDAEKGILQSLAEKDKGLVVRNYSEFMQVANL